MTSIEDDIQRAVQRLINFMPLGTYLVTGATGMLGRYLVKMLVHFQGVTVIAGCHSKEKGLLLFDELKGYKNFIMEEFDVCSQDWNITCNVDYILHAAGICDNEYCKENPSEVIYNNVMGTYRILKFAEEKKVKRLIVFSSAAVYGRCDVERLSEDNTGYIDFRDFRNAYAISKRVLENMCDSYKEKISLTIIRPFHMISPEQLCISSSMLGEFFQNLQSGKEIKLRGNGLSMRNFTYIVDMCEVILLLISCPRGTYNIGNKHGDWSVVQALENMKDVFEKLNMRMQEEVNIDFDDEWQKPGNANHLLPELSKIQYIIQKKGYELQMELPQVALEKSIIAIGGIHESI